MLQYYRLLWCTQVAEDVIMELCTQLKIDSASEMDEYSIYALRDKGANSFVVSVVQPVVRPMGRCLRQGSAV